MRVLFLERAERAHARAGDKSAYICLRAFVQAMRDDDTAGVIKHYSELYKMDGCTENRAEALSAMRDLMIARAKKGSELPVDMELTSVLLRRCCVDRKLLTAFKHPGINLR